ncbi:hypothetical protein [Lactococcus lactis]|uniref:Uncharacterized protein n=1 Tax=Lactococcus lactis TaxID=1358 RepID=A0AAE4NUF6_9LACT|nr:hypothetical protein [Lactococcus lactis]MDQ7188792.1 hypothetical protein [Lactococcus lactis]MDT2858857.1 hypothetical protein [Lactococcus lactis]MDT2917978.1 hypothetical protein [Lactococcus lactis]MDV2633826.1 hypothetical protein [Lactococcus lactis]
MTIFILILGFIVVLIMAAPSYGESLDEKRNKIDTQLNELNIDTETYFLKNNQIKIGVDVKQRKVFEVGLEDKTYEAKLQLIDLNNVIDVEIIEDNQVINKVSNSSMIGRAVVGGVLTGGVGAIIGGHTAKSKTTKVVKEISLRFRMNDMDNPYYDVIVFNDSKGLDRGSDLFKSKSKEILDLFGRIELVLEKGETYTNIK